MLILQFQTWKNQITNFISIKIFIKGADKSHLQLTLLSINYFSDKLLWHWEKRYTKSKRWIYTKFIQKCLQMHARARHEINKQKEMTDIDSDWFSVLSFLYIQGFRRSFPMPSNRITAQKPWLVWSKWMETKIKSFHSRRWAGGSLDEEHGWRWTMSTVNPRDPLSSVLIQIQCTGNTSWWFLLKMVEPHLGMYFVERCNVKNVAFRKMPLLHIWRAKLQLLKCDHDTCKFYGH